MALLNGQMLGRWGNFFNREAFGEYTDGLFAMRLPVDAVRSGDITEKMWQHMETIGGVDYIQVSSDIPLRVSMVRRASDPAGAVPEA